VVGLNIKEMRSLKIKLGHREICRCNEEIRAVMKWQELILF